MTPGNSQTVGCVVGMFDISAKRYSFLILVIITDAGARPYGNLLTAET